MYQLRKRDIISLILCCSIRSNLPKSTRIVHPFGISIGEDITFGKNCIIYQNVSIGRRWTDIESKMTIGNNVTICSGACLVGDLTIGNNVIIGANSVVLENIPDNCTAVGNPARIIKKRG
ncbi:MAG: serine acetyltransferase [archaeon]